MRIGIDPVKMYIRYDKDAVEYVVSFKDMHNEIHVDLHIDPLRFYKIQEKILCVEEDRWVTWDFSECDEE